MREHREHSSAQGTWQYTGTQQHTGNTRNTTGHRKHEGTQGTWQHTGNTIGHMEQNSTHAGLSTLTVFL